MEKRKQNKNALIDFIKGCGIVMSKVGTIGFAVIAITSYIIFFVPQDLKNELTNTWLLFKCRECQNVYVIVFVILIAMVVIQSYFYGKAFAEKDQRIKELSRERTILQEKFLKKNLSSSK